VEKADVNLNLPGLIRFLLAHFRDVPLLKEYLEICKSLLLVLSLPPPGTLMCTVRTPLSQPL
jgi:hypothetical protein